MKNLFSLMTLVFFVFLFWASSTPEKISKTFNTYEDVKPKTDEPVTLTYDMPIIQPSSETKQTQIKVVSQ